MAMKRIVNKARSFEEADEWDIRQQLAMTQEERILAARALPRRAFGDHPKGVRECGVLVLGSKLPLRNAAEGRGEVC